MQLSRFCKYEIVHSKCKKYLLQIISTHQKTVKLSFTIDFTYNLDSKVRSHGYQERSKDANSAGGLQLGVLLPVTGFWDLELVLKGSEQLCYMQDGLYWRGRLLLFFISLRLNAYIKFVECILWRSTSCCRFCRVQVNFGSAASAEYFTTCALESCLALLSCYSVLIYCFSWWANCQFFSRDHQSERWSRLWYVVSEIITSLNDRGFNSNHLLTNKLSFC